MRGQQNERPAPCSASAPSPPASKARARVNRSTGQSLLATRARQANVAQGTTGFDGASTGVAAQERVAVMHEALPPVTLMFLNLVWRVLRPLSPSPLSAPNRNKREETQEQNKAESQKGMDYSPYVFYPFYNVFLRHKWCTPGQKGAVNHYFLPLLPPQKSSACVRSLSAHILFIPTVLDPARITLGNPKGSVRFISCSLSSAPPLSLFLSSFLLSSTREKAFIHRGGTTKLAEQRECSCIQRRHAPSALLKGPHRSHAHTHTNESTHSLFRPSLCAVFTSASKKRISSSSPHNNSLPPR